MNINKELMKIAKAKMAFKKEHGFAPSLLCLQKETLEQIKTALYENTPIDPKEIPLNKFEGMQIIIDDDAPESWRIAS